LGHPRVSARDAIHLAIMEQYKIEQILTLTAASMDFPALSDWRNAPRKSARPGKREMGRQLPVSRTRSALAYRIGITREWPDVSVSSSRIVGRIRSEIS
jgi:hypothetical protein